jgi:transposase
MKGIFRLARKLGLIEERPEASIDATGLESHHISRHFLARQGRMKRFRKYPKLTVVCHHRSHLIVAAEVRDGPYNDAADFSAAVRQAHAQLPISRLYGDAAYDSEAHHQFCREELGITSTVIPINHRGRPEARPRGRYRRQMDQNFPTRQYGQRWQVESVFSQHKRRLGSALRARRSQARYRECFLRVLTHDLMILRRAS